MNEPNFLTKNTAKDIEEIAKKRNSKIPYQAVLPFTTLERTTPSFCQRESSSGNPGDHEPTVQPPNCSTPQNQHLNQSETPFPTSRSKVTSDWLGRKTSNTADHNRRGHQCIPLVQKKKTCPPIKPLYISCTRSSAKNKQAESLRLTVMSNVFLHAISIIPWRRCPYSHCSRRSEHSSEN